MKACAVHNFHKNLLQLSLYFTSVLTTELTGRNELGKVNIR